MAHGFFKYLARIGKVATWARGRRKYRSRSGPSVGFATARGALTHPPRPGSSVPDTADTGWLEAEQILPPA